MQPLISEGMTFALTVSQEWVTAREKGMHQSIEADESILIDLVWQRSSKLTGQEQVVAMAG